MKRFFTQFCVLLLLSLVAAGPTLAAAGVSDYPEKPIKLVVPFPPGGSTDALARMLGQKIGEQFGQPVIVENRAGASGNIGASYAAKSAGDGYTLFLGSSPVLSVNQSLYATLPYDPQKDFAPIVLATMLPSIVVVNPSLPVKTMAQLTALLKKSNPPLSYASTGPGTPSHLGGEMYKRLVGVKATHIPYKGGAPALSDLVGGQTSYMFAILPEAMPLVKNGQLRALAVTTAHRLPAYPDLPTVAESGVPGYELIAWYGFLAPAATPPAIIAKLNGAFNRALKDPDVNGKLTNMGFEVLGGPPEKLSNLMRSETAKWKKVITEAGIKIN